MPRPATAFASRGSRATVIVIGVLALLFTGLGGAYVVLTKVRVPHGEPNYFSPKSQQGFEVDQRSVAIGDAFRKVFEHSPSFRIAVLADIHGNLLALIWRCLGLVGND